MKSRRKKERNFMKDFEIYDGSTVASTDHEGSKSNAFIPTEWFRKCCDIGIHNSYKLNNPPRFIRLTFDL
jgi:hypothetical protein